jgi:hypothetical protein
LLLLSFQITYDRKNLLKLDEARKNKTEGAYRTAIRVVSVKIRPYNTIWFSSLATFNLR